MIDDKFSIQITGTGEEVPASSLTVLQTFIKILRDVNSQMTQDKKPNLEWNFSRISMNSPLVADAFPSATHGSDVGKDVVIACAKGLQQIQAGSEELPPYFQRKTLRYAKSITGALNNGITGIRVSTPFTDPFSITNRFAVNSIFITKDSYEDYGTFEGVLLTLTLERSDHIIIRDDIFGRIPCYFNEDMKERARSLWAERVSVSGVTTYTRSGLPKSIQAEDVIRLSSQSELPQWEDLKHLNLTVHEMFDLGRNTDGERPNILG